MYENKSVNLNFIHCVRPGDHTGIALTLFGLIFFVFIFIFINIIPTNAQAVAEADSTVKRFPPVRVTADRIISNSAVDYSPYSIISKEQFEESSSLQISDVLENVPGVFIKNYGGAGGMKTISMRGTSAQQTIVMIDGMRINSNQNGIVDLSTLPMSFIDDIEVVRGGNAAFFGGNSVGGAVNIRTNIDKQSAKINASAKYGSYGETGIDVFASKPFENFSAAISCDYISSDGKYEFERADAGTIGSFARINADFSNFSLSAFVDTEVDEWIYKARVISSMSERGIPGAVTEGNIENSESRLDEKDLILLVSGMKVFDSGNSLHIGI
ncbi:MAG: TonB-dependent receptor plug domain-containing protein, partial [Candidatus Kapabacteria bacterium]|nr:TonB-dependent receptor plug domain-containing protein [Candidatus Kapabacteria bacterium]